MATPQLQFEGYAGIKTFIRQEDEKDLLRFMTAGSVDDGKSTLIGRLLYDCKGVYEDQIAALCNSPVNRSTSAFDLALLTDGLRAEREQGITIDVAYRYFSTSKRKFIIADTPGHEQYTRNMATGASTADLAVILIDARNGVLLQSRRHAFIASILGIQHLLVAINKMDLVDYNQQIFNRVCSTFATYAANLGTQNLHFVPVSALNGDNVVEKSARMPWFHGRTLLEHLETVPFLSNRKFEQFRFPVQYVIRPRYNFRGYAGQIVSGAITVGDQIVVLPSGCVSRVKSIVTYDGELREAFAPMSVTICLETEIDIARGDMLVDPLNPPQISRCFDATMVWMHEQPLETDRVYLLKHTTHVVRARVDAVQYRIDVNSFQKESSNTLRLNEIGTVVITTQQPLFCDSYDRSRSTGSFILMNPMNNATVAAGMIAETASSSYAADTKHTNAVGSMASGVKRLEHESRAGHPAVTIWINKDSGGFAYELERTLFNKGYRVHAIRHANEQKVAELCRVLNDAGVIAICQSSNDELRELTRKTVGGTNFSIINSEVNGNSLEQAGDCVYKILREVGFGTRSLPHGA